jgi:two-component system, OmpR family, phosphate regulon sensor histidine kinase PhoR
MPGRRFTMKDTLKLTDILANRYKWLPHPTVLFLFSMAALGLTLFLCIFWYIEVKNGLEELIGRLNVDLFLLFQSRTWIVIIIFTLIGGVILAGIFMSFMYYQKVLQLYSHQQNFINNFTHELKTPVTSLKLYLETFIKHDLTKEDQQKYLRYMLSDVSRLSGNINSILNLARLESHEYDGEFVPKNPVALVREFINVNSHLFPICDIHLISELKKDISIPVDKYLFEILLMNILTNAMKYNHCEKCFVDIKFTSRLNKIMISFKDNGIGIEKKELKKVFRKFYQVAMTGHRASEGSGLGLYLVSIIAKIHGGEISVRSPGPGKGSEFILTLPIFSVIHSFKRT